MYLLPKPQKIEMKSEKYYIPYEAEIRISDICERYVQEYAELLKIELEESAGVGCHLGRKGGKKGASFFLTINPGRKKEGYKLVIDENGGFIEGGDSRGLLYGIQTLRQILRQEGAALPCLEIEDYPLMENRGFYLDSTRGRVPTLASLKETADTLSFYKMNQLQIYVEHSFLMDGLSEMWRDDTPLSVEDILELDAYCKRRGIELVPSLSLFGHLYKLLRTTGFAHLGEFPGKAEDPFSFIGRQEHHTLNVTLDESFELVKRMIKEYLPLFSSRKFNIGADETFDLGKGAGKEAAQKDGTKRLYIDFVKKICTFLIQEERIPMFWGDVICGFPELITELPKETICLNWGYAWDQGEEDVKALEEAGAVQYVCPGTGGWNQFVNLMGSAYSNISRMCAYGEKYHAVGVLNTDWGDFGHINHPTSSIPGLIYGAALSWNREEISLEEMNRRISKVEYRDHSEKIMEILSLLCRQSSFGWDTAVSFQEFQTGAIDWPRERADLYMQERLELMGKAREMNQTIQSCEQDLRLCVGNMDSQARKKMYPFLLMADGMKIFNSIGNVVGARCFGIPQAQKIDGKELAEELECWFYHYKNLWRSVSRESELYRIGNVIFWYGDFLRKMSQLL